MRAWNRITRLSLLAVVVATVPAPAIAAPANPPTAPPATAAWTPEAPVYGIGEHKNVPVRMSDGVVLRANVYFPTDPKSGAAASGPFPVVMVQTPYGKDVVGSASGQEGGAEAASETGPVPYLIKRGYIDVVAEVRGTGNSEGTFDLLDPVQGRDGTELVSWAAKLPGSNGRVGLYGPSYMGLDQFMTANQIGPNSPLKAIFPIVAGADTYRDIAFQGGILDGEFSAIAIGTIFGPLEELAPLAEAQDVGDLVKVESQHAPGLLSYNAAQASNIELGGDQAYDEDYWQRRAPRNMLENVVANGIPAYMVGGYFDLYQRGEPLVYSGLQNAYSHRPVTAPMTADQPATGRYQLMQGPWYHLTAGTGVDIYAIQLAWFDRWLKDEPTGIESTGSPLHAYEINGDRWVDVARYPFEQATPTTLFLSGGPSASGAPSLNDGTLAGRAPTAPAAEDTVTFTAASSPCSRQTEQWGAGGGALALEAGQLPPDPCTEDDRTLQTGPGALTYTSAAFGQDTVLAGPIDATIYANANRAEVELVATIEDVAPSGVSFPLTSGALLGSFRGLDGQLSWMAADGRPLLPYHPYTRASVVAVPAGEVTRYDIEVFPTVARLRAGHRLRLTLTTSDTPHLLPTSAQAAALAGGVYRVQRTAKFASFLEVPLVAASSFSSGAVAAAPAAAAACASHRRVTIHVARGGRVLRSSVRINGKLASAPRSGPRGLRIDLHGRASGTYFVAVFARMRGGRLVHTVRTYHTCRPGPRPKPVRRHLNDSGARR